MFQPAKRTQAKIKLAVTGPSGSGKTYSSLLLASGLGEKIAVIDTENGSASLYSDQFKFDIAKLDPPYTVEKYVAAIKAAEAAQYDVLVIDSLSHAWAGEGGLLQQKEAMDARGGNSYMNWAKMTPMQEKFIASILHSKVHIIATMRSKQDYVLQETDKGKIAPKKVGLAPVQREGLEYEFTTVFDIAIDHSAIASKDRTGLFDNRIFKITKETGAEFAAWLNGASVEELKVENTGKVEQPTQYPASLASKALINELMETAKTRGWPSNVCANYIKVMYDKTSSQMLTPEECMAMIDQVKTMTGFEASTMLSTKAQAGEQ